MQNNLYDIIELARRGERVSAEDAITLWREAPLWVLGELAVERKRRMSGDMVFFNRNIHIEPTNICLFNCEFCSFRRREGDADAWYMSIDEVIARAAEMKTSGITEVHIVGGVHPKHTLDTYCAMVRGVKSVLPNVTVKAYTAVEILYMIRNAGVSIIEGLKQLQEAGMECIPGGGAEIFDEELRRKICPEKCSSDEWLAVHRAAHNLGIKTNCTMLYGHVESIEQRVDHLQRLRLLQEETSGFDAFIPLKYRSRHNRLSEVGECSVEEDMRTIAMSRIFLDNIPHIKAYWVAYGKQTTEMALAFGADDIDGTIDNSTKIYSMAGADERPTMSVAELCSLVHDAGFVAVERDTHYNHIKRYDSCDAATTPQPQSDTTGTPKQAEADRESTKVVAAGAAATTASVATATAVGAKAATTVTAAATKTATAATTAAQKTTKGLAAALYSTYESDSTSKTTTMNQEASKRTERKTTQSEKSSCFATLLSKFKGDKQDKKSSKTATARGGGGRRKNQDKGGRWQHFWGATKRAYGRFPILFHMLFIFLFLLIIVGVLYLGLRWGTRHNETTAVPNFIGMSLSEAEGVAAAADLQIVVRDTVFDEYAMPGEVVEQSPRTSDIRTVTVKPGRRIYLTINSMDSRMVDMVNVSGKTLRAAIGDLQRAGLTIDRLIFEPDYSHDNVIRQRVGNREVTKDNIGSWESVPYNTGVTLCVTFDQKYPNSRITEEPNVTGMTIRQAKSALWNKGLNVGDIHYDSSVEDRQNRRDARVYMQEFNATSPNVPYRGDVVSLYLTCDSLLVDSLAPAVKNRLLNQRHSIEAHLLEQVADTTPIVMEQTDMDITDMGEYVEDELWRDVASPVIEEEPTLDIYYGDEDDFF